MGTDELSDIVIELIEVLGEYESPNDMWIERLINNTSEDLVREHLPQQYVDYLETVISIQRKKIEKMTSEALKKGWDIESELIFRIDKDDLDKDD